MTGLAAEIRYASRVLSKARGFTAVAALTLALGIGANTAIFTMADAILYRPYPFRDLSRIVALRETVPKVTADRYAVSPG
jgi:putative ABC transport system permease protein